MKNKIFIGITILGLSALLLTSCSKVPQTEIDAANAAVEQAKAAGADVYVHENYVVLEDSLKGVMVSIELQKSKFIKNFSTAKEHLDGVAQFAGEVKQQAETRKEELKVEIQNTISEIKNLIDVNRKLILEAPKGKGGTSALVAIKGEIDAIETSVNEINTAFETGDYPSVLDKAKAAKEKATSINTELSGVIAKYKANVMNRK